MDVVFYDKRPMNKIVRVLIIFFLTFVISLLEACIVHERTIIGVSLHMAEISQYNDGSEYYRHLNCKYLEDNMCFAIRRKNKSIKNAAIHINNSFFINECNAAVRPGIRYVNDLLETSYKLYFDKAIIYNEDTIFANTNLLEKLSYKIGKEYPDTDYIVFQKGIINEIEFETLTFKAFFSCLTSDGKELTASTNVVIVKDE